MSKGQSLATLYGSSLLLATAAMSITAPAVAAEPIAPLQCEEDETSEAPTISARFELKEPAPGSASFADAMQRALRYCATQACTAGGQTMARKPSVYALGILHRRYIVGFRCLPENPARQNGGATTLDYRLGDPSEIDTAKAKASEACAATQAKAELSDLRRAGEAIIATFACSL